MPARVRSTKAPAPPRGRSPIQIHDALADPNLLGAALGDISSWTVWAIVLKAAMGIQLSPRERERFQKVAGEREPPAHRVDELWAVVGRRSGKTRTAAAIACYIGAIEQHQLAVGETGYVLCLAASRSQATVCFRYVVAFLQASPILRQQIESITAEEVRLKNNVIIGVHTNSFRTIRGKSLLAVIGDETSFWRDEASAAPDVEVYRACMPALAATGGIFVGISTGWRRAGLLYAKWRDHFAQTNNDILVVQGGTELFNPTLSRETIAKARAADPEAADSEWMGGWRDDVLAFLDDATVERAVDYERPLELPPRADIAYQAFSDASGGRHDAFTIAIGHREQDKIVCDVIRGVRPPFDPASVVKDYAKLLREYRVKTVSGDNYSAEWVASAWRDNGVTFVRSEINKSQIYLESLPHFVRGAMSIPNVPALTRELRLLERRVSRLSGKALVDHGRSGSDDWANAFCGMAQMLADKSPKYNYDTSMEWVQHLVGTPEEWRDAQLAAHMMTGARRW